MESITEDLYTYLKDKYGIKETEIFNKVKSITKSVDVKIAGIRKNTSDHKWKVFIEKGNDNEKSLIIGEEWPDGHTSWSRYLEILDHQSKDYSFPFLEIIGTLYFKKDEDFETLRIFLNIFKEFFATVSK